MNNIETNEQIEANSADLKDLLERTLTALERKRRNRFIGLLIGVLVIASIPIITTTYAGIIRVSNPGERVEFGQGIAATAACDPDGITIIPNAEYSQTDGKFMVKSIQIKGIDLRNSTQYCVNKVFDIYVQGSGGTLLNWVASNATNFNGSSALSYASFKFTDANNAVLIRPDSSTVDFSAIAFNLSDTATTASATISMKSGATLQISSDQAEKIIIQTKDS
jgi:hypothetical protein